VLKDVVKEKCPADMSEEERGRADEHATVLAASVFAKIPRCLISLHLVKMLLANWPQMHAHYHMQQWRNERNAESKRVCGKPEDAIEEVFSAK